MNRRSQRICLWSGVLFMALFFIGFGLVARFIPPPQPDSPVADVVSNYADHGVRIRIGMVLSAYALVCFVPWVAVITVQLKRIEGPSAPLAHAQLALGAGLPVAFFPSIYFFSNAAFRADRSPEVIQALNDQGWLPFTGIIYAIVLQNLVIAAAVFSDRSVDPIYPRWFGYFCAWTALLYCPASLDVFFVDGPLAWNGLLSWWLSLVAFFAWLVVTTVLTFRAVNGDEQGEHDPGHDPAAHLEERIARLEEQLILQPGSAPVSMPPEVLDTRSPRGL